MHKHSFCNEIGQSYSEVSATLWLYTVSDQTTQEINVIVMQTPLPLDFMSLPLLHDTFLIQLS